ncbi:type VI secretion system protein TssL, long form [Neisseriaceae bacterium TC5R-5]|nr:type VI secretion system protein TssL, long form [Neisseriaceae bacterium TC5R-5]
MSEEKAADGLDFLTDTSSDEKILLNNHSEGVTSRVEDIGNSKKKPDSELYRAEAIQDAQTRLQQIQTSPNPLLEACQPLLRALAEIPLKLEGSSNIEKLRELLGNEVNIFQKLCDKANISWKHMAVARYCICTALDEAANATAWGGSGVWANNSLLLSFEGEVDGGEKFFLLIGRMAMDPQEYVNVLEVVLRILGLGFEGRYSVVEDGRRHLDQIRQRLLTLIGTAREPVSLELSTHWRGEKAGRMPLLHSIPVWSSALFLSLILFGLFFWYKYQLLNQSVHLEKQIIELAKVPSAVPINIANRRLRLSELLKNEIAKKMVVVNEKQNESKVVFKGDAMFMPGKSSVRPEVMPILEKVTNEINRVKGRVLIIGHSDAMPIKSSEFPNNQALSEKRAAEVGRFMEGRGLAASQITAKGMGDTQPIADNSTIVGRAQNRRVEILVTE